MSKTPQSNATYRGGGSIGIIGAARAGYVVAKDPDNPDVCVLACVKSNLAPMPESLTFQLVSDQTYNCARIQWGGVSSLSANELVCRTETDDERVERNETQTWLLDYLHEHGDSSSREVIKAGQAAGFSQSQIKDARRRCHNPKVSTTRSSFGGTPYWSIGGTFLTIATVPPMPPLPELPPMDDEPPPDKEYEPPADLWDTTDDMPPDDDTYN